MKPAECPVCGADHARRIDHRANTPVMMNRLYATGDAARASPRGTLDIVTCMDCGFAWNRAFDPNLVIYDRDYENDQSHSDAFAAHVAARARDIVAAVPLDQPIDYLEIGCGQGAFIADVANAAGGRLRSAEGFDPAWRGTDGAALPELTRSRIHKVYFTAKTSRRLAYEPNVAATRHTIEHVPDPVGFLCAIREALGLTSRTRLFIETPCIEWILEHRAMQDLFYEHCSIFSADALKQALEKAGFGHVAVTHVFGGQYLWASGAAGEARDPSRATHVPSSRVAASPTFSGVEFAQTWRDKVEIATEKGPVAIWGAGAKGVTFALLTDPEARLFDCAIDINPAKQGRYLAGSGLAVLSPELAALRGLRTIFVMNPNYLDEISRQTAKLGIDAALLPIN
jgi:hypothetical protein